MPLGPDNDPLFETVRSRALPDVAAWGFSHIGATVVLTR